MTGTLAITGGGLRIGGSSDPGANNLFVQGRCTVDGDLIVNGSTTTISTQELQVKDNVVQLNRYDGTAASPRYAGIEIYRGQAVAKAQLMWDESDDLWKISTGTGTDLLPIATGVARDVVTGVIVFADLPLDQEMVSNEILPGLGAGPIYVLLGVDEPGPGMLTNLSDPALREVSYHAELNRTTGGFRVFTRRMSGNSGTVHVRWWAQMARELPPPNPVVSIGVTIEPKSASLQTGDTRQFSATVTNTTNFEVNWTASGASIDVNGLFTATSGGTFTVTATSQADPGKRATASVSVAAIAISVAPANPSLKWGETVQFVPAVTGSSNTGVRWSTTGGSIDQQGQFKTTSSGSFTVTATSLADPSKQGTTSVSVATIVVSVAPVSASLMWGETVQFVPTVTGASDSDTGVRWSASGGSIDADGLFTATSSGSFTVTATSLADPSKQATTSVSVATIVVGVAPETSSVTEGQTQQFIATVTGASDTRVGWTANGGSIDANGLFTATSPGAFSVTATSQADPSKHATANVSVTPVVSVAPKTAWVEKLDSVTFVATVISSSLPAGYRGSSVRWSATGRHANNPGQDRFLINAHDPNTADFQVWEEGTYTVTATTTILGDPIRSASATVTVENVAVTISPQDPVIAPGESVQFTAKVTGPTRGTRNVTWDYPTDGLFTAPSSNYLPSSPFLFHASAISDHEGGLWGTSHPSCQATGYVIDVTVGVEPQKIELAVGDSCEFEAFVTRGLTNAFTWSVTGDATITPKTNPRYATLTVTATGKPGDTITVTATSTEAGHHFATAVVTIIQ